MIMASFTGAPIGGFVGGQIVALWLLPSYGRSVDLHCWRHLSAGSRRRVGVLAPGVAALPVGARQAEFARSGAVGPARAISLGAGATASCARHRPGQPGQDAVQPRLMRFLGPVLMWIIAPARPDEFVPVRLLDADGVLNLIGFTIASGLCLEHEGFRRDLGGPLSRRGDRPVWARAFAGPSLCGVGAVFIGLIALCCHCLCGPPGRRPSSPEWRSSAARPASTARAASSTRPACAPAASAGRSASAAWAVSRRRSWADICCRSAWRRRISSSARVSLPSWPRAATALLASCARGPRQRLDGGGSHVVKVFVFDLLAYDANLDHLKGGENRSCPTRSPADISTATRRCALTL